MYQSLLCYVTVTCLLLCQLVATDETELRLEEVYDSNRLPTAVTPENYKLEIITHLDDEEGFTFKGNVLITVSL